MSESTWSDEVFVEALAEAHRQGVGPGVVGYIEAVRDVRAFGGLKSAALVGELCIVRGQVVVLGRQAEELERTKDHLAAMQRDRDALAARVRELEAKTAELAWGGSQ